MKEYWITNNRFKFIAVLLLIIFLIFITFLYLKADEITKDPCSICAKNMGEEVVCTIGSFVFLQRTYFPNGSIVQES